MPVSGNAANTDESAGVGPSEYISLCTSQIPCQLLAVRNDTQLLSR